VSEKNETKDIKGIIDLHFRQAHHNLHDIAVIYNLKPTFRETIENKFAFLLEGLPAGMFSQFFMVTK
jgi:hypothetical protein